MKSVASATLEATTEVQPAAGGSQAPRQEKPSQEGGGQDYSFLGHMSV